MLSCSLLVELDKFVKDFSFYRLYARRPHFPAFCELTVHSTVADSRGTSVDQLVSNSDFTDVNVLPISRGYNCTALNYFGFFLQIFGWVAWASLLSFEVTGNVLV